MNTRTSTTTSKTGSTYRRPATDYERERRNAYQRRYRAAHRDRVRQWQMNFYVRLAERLKAEAEEATGDGD